MTITDSGRPGDEVRARHDGRCYVCGHLGTFELRCRSSREGFTCPECRASLRYQHQARTIIDSLAATATDLTTLSAREEFGRLAIYEPGLIGPYRKLWNTLPKYQNSYFWPDVTPGQSHDGVRCENLERLTFPEGSFDLVVTSDIFEHVRKPWDAFASILRVLAPGGRHVMSVPVTHPIPAVSRARVDTSTDEDRFIEEPVYHGSPRDPQGSLVYTDFGADLPQRLTDLGYHVSLHHGAYQTHTYVMRRPV